MGANSSFVADLPAIARASRQLTVEPNAQQAVTALLAALRADLDIERTEVLAYDDQDEILETVAAIDALGTPELAVRRTPLSAADPIYQRVVRREIPQYFAPLCSTDATGAVTPARAVVPIVSGDEFLGLLHVQAHPPGKQIPAHALDPLYLYAGLAALPLFALRQQREDARLDWVRRKIYRDVLFSVTSGKLRMCEWSEIQAEWPAPAAQFPIRRGEDIRRVRDAVRRLGQEQEMAGDRTEDFGLCASEAATNALVHGSGGSAALEARDGRLRIRIEDCGTGIQAADLPRATLLKGWSSCASMGMGFAIIKEMADQVLLCTSPWGTTIIIEMAAVPSESFLDRFHPLLGLQEYALPS